MSEKHQSEEFVVQAMQQWSSTVFRLAFAQTASRADAEDVHQEVFIKLYKTTRQFEDDQHLKAWLLRVTINCCRDLARSGWQRKVTSFKDLDYFVSESNTSSLKATDELASALEKLPEDMRAVVHLHYFEELTSQEIARILDVNASTVRSRLERARNQLRTLLGGAKNGSHEFL